MFLLNFKVGEFPDGQTLTLGAAGLVSDRDVSPGSFGVPSPW